MASSTGVEAVLQTGGQGGLHVFDRHSSGSLIQTTRLIGTGWGHRVALDPGEVSDATQDRANYIICIYYIYVESG